MKAQLLLTKKTKSVRLAACNKIKSKACAKDVKSIPEGKVNYATKKAHKLNSQLCKKYPKKIKSCKTLCDLFKKLYPNPVTVKTCTKLPTDWQRECLNRLPPLPEIST